jgi:hypothetical protein
LRLAEADMEPKLELEDDRLSAPEDGVLSSSGLMASGESE